MLDNNGSERLTHLVIAAPPFNPKDVKMVPFEGVRPQPGKLLRKSVQVMALDGVRVSELLTRREREMTSISVALGELKPSQRSPLHKHAASDEAYFILEGDGVVTSGELHEQIGKDTLISVPKTNKHGLENNGKSRLRVLAFESPPYKEEDFYPIETA